MTRTRSQRVSMVTRELNSYRVAFFDEARRLLADEHIEFDLFVGGATSADRAKGDPATLDWAKNLAVREISVRGRELWWQPVIKLARSSDMIITEQASKQLSNVPLAMLQRAGAIRHGLWGHGRNFQQSIEGGSGEGLKSWFTRSAHWFFSYTEASSHALVDLGFPASRITTFNNSTDVREAREAQSSLSPSCAEDVRTELGIGAGPIVAYLGALYPPKRTPFLLDSLDALRAEVSNVEVIVMGGGSDADLVAHRARERPWLHHLGPVYGLDRVRFASCSELLLMPGLLGLNVVDGFALGLPTVTTAIDYHSPEIAYLSHGVNGWICDEDVSPAQYAREVAEILRNPDRLARLRAGALRAGDDLGIEPMAVRFANGVKAALDAPRRRGPYVDR
ncbi:MAG: glycosyltransferase [Acidimicrobiia bacterium]|nr:glycosyltransferase [Acidimicrobiia bacterium]